MKTSNQKLQNYVFVAGLIVFTGVLAVFLWLATVRNTPEKLFWAAIEQSLSTTGVTRRFSSESDTQRLVQVTRLNYAGSLQADTTLTITGIEGSKAVSQLLGTADEDYIRYRDITGDELPENVKDRWAVLPRQNGARTGLLGQALLGTALPTGNFNASNRAKLMDFLRQNNVYAVQEFTEKGVEIEGRTTDVVAVMVDVVTFQRFLKDYLLMMGLNDAAESVATPLEGDKIRIEVAIHASSRQIVKIGFDGLDSSSSEVYGQWGGSSKLDIPSDTINFDELQAAFANREE